MKNIDTATTQYTVEEAAEILTLSLPDEIISYYENTYNDNAMAISEYLIEQWVLPANLSLNTDTFGLNAIVNYILWEAFINPPTQGKPPLTEREALEHYVQLRRSRRDYLYRNVRDEILGRAKPKTTHYIEESWNALTSPYLKNVLNNDKELMSKEDYFSVEYEKVVKWHNNSESYLFNFPYFSALPAKRRAVGFIQDVGWFVFNKICKDFYRNKFGFITQSPDMTFGIHSQDANSPSPVINWQASAISAENLKYDATNDSVTVYETIQANDDTKVKIIVDVIHNIDCSTPEKRDLAIRKISDEYKNGERVGHLDATDFSIITAVFNNMTFEIATGKDDLILTFTELSSDVYGSDYKMSLKRCTDLFKRLLKLNKMSITSSMQDENGVPIYGAAVNFFTFQYSITGTYKAKKSGQLTPSHLKAELDLSGEANISNINLLTKDHYNNMVLVISPSEYMRNQWQSGIHTAISSQLYQQITSQKGKLFLQILQKERLRIYPETFSRITMIYIRTQIRVDSNDYRRLKKDLALELENLKQENLLIDDYSINRSSIDITFKPFSDPEKIMFKIKNPASLM